MLTQSVLAVVEDVLNKCSQAGATKPDVDVCMQMACVRALVDEVENHSPSNHLAIAALQHQLLEEVARLLELVNHEMSAGRETVPCSFDDANQFTI